MSARPLEGKLAIVTGASRGIGFVIATKIASYGANLVLGYTSPSSGEAAAALAKDLAAAHGIRAVPVQADLGTNEGGASLVAQAKAAYPDNFQIDILINNAGVAHNALLPSVTPQQFDISYRVNVLGPLLLVQAAEPYLPRDRSGRIVNISSVSSSCGFIEQSVYGGTKAALEAMTRTWARELGERCTVNAVNPGPVLSEMYALNTDDFKAGIKGWISHAPLMRTRRGIDSDELCDDEPNSGGRPAYLEEVADVVAMLCGKDSRWTTGQVVSANGGMLMSGPS